MVQLRRHHLLPAHMAAVVDVAGYVYVVLSFIHQRVAYPGHRYTCTLGSEEEELKNVRNSVTYDFLKKNHPKTPSHPETKGAFAIFRCPKSNEYCEIAHIIPIWLIFVSLSLLSDD